MTSATLMGSVINVHTLGATVRLEDGRLAAVPLADLEAHRTSYQRSLTARKKLPFAVREEGYGRTATLASEMVEDPAPAAIPEAEAETTVATAETAAPVETAEQLLLTDDVFEERLADYLRATEEWAPPDQAQPFERHLTKKRRRAAQFPSEEETRQKYRGS
jgi:hypothetical protein